MRDIDYLKLLNDKFPTKRSALAEHKPYYNIGLIKEK